MTGRWLVRFGVVLFAAALLFGLVACGDEEGDIVSPAISAHADNAFFTTSSSVTLKVNVEVGAVLEVAVADGLTASLAAFEGTGSEGDTWSFVVSGLQPGGNAIAVTAQDATGNQQTLFMSVTYDFLAIDSLVAPVDTSTTSYEVRGTVADGGVPTVTVESTTLSPFDPADVVVTAGADAREWIASITLPGVEDLYTITVNRNNGTHNVTKTTTFTVSDSGYPVATITSQPFVITESLPTDRNITVTGTRLAGASVVFKLNSIEQTVTFPDATTWSSDVTLSPGKNFLTLTVTDDAGTLLTTTAFDAIWYELP